MKPIGSPRRPKQIWQQPSIWQAMVLIAIPIAVIVTLVLPLTPTARLKLLILAATAGGYSALILAPVLPNRKSIAEIAPLTLMAFGHALFITTVTVVLADTMPMIAVFQVVAIIAIAAQGGIRIAMWSALLATFGTFSAFAATGILAAQTPSGIALIGAFFIIAFLAGALAQSANQNASEFENVVTHSQETILIFDANTHIDYINAAGLTLTGYALEEILGRSFFDFVANPDANAARSAWERLRVHPTADQVFTVHVTVKNDVRRTLAVSVTPLADTPNRFLAIARDITAQETERAEHERRDRELNAERAVAIAVSQTLELERVLTLALEQTLVALQGAAGAIYLADAAETTLTLAVQRNLPPQQVDRLRHYKFGEGLPGAAAAHRHAELIENMGADSRTRIAVPAAQTIAHVSVPLITQDHIAGVLSINSHNQRTFTSTDLDLLGTIAATVAVAIDHARLFETLEQRVAERTAELAALNRLAAAVNQSLDLDTILNAALTELIETLHVRGGWVRLLNPQDETLVLRAEKGRDLDLPISDRAIKPGEGLSGRVYLAGKPLAVNVAESDLTNRAQSLAQGYRAMMATPLWIENKIVGVLGLTSDERDRFGETELRWLGAIGNTIAVAIHNVQLFQATQHQVRQLAALREIDHVTNSLLELEPLMSTMLRRLAELVPYDNAAVLLLDGTNLRTVAAYGRDQAALMHVTFNTTHNAIFQNMARTRAAVILHDVRADPAWVTAAGMEFGRAWLGAPLIARDEVIGQIGVFNATPGGFTSEHSALLLAFADHAAVTIANARLRAELHEQARRDSLTSVLNHGTFITELRAAYADAQAQGQPLALIMLDLDNFKQYNDRYGHVVGDMVLVVTTQAIRAHIKQTDFVGRWGGEEFAIALPGADITLAQLIATRIRTTLAETPVVDRHNQAIPSPTASQGIAALCASTGNVDDLIERADRALYVAKRHGKDQVALAAEK